jgi:hypothetical protein
MAMMNLDCVYDTSPSLRALKPPGGQMNTMKNPLSERQVTPQTDLDDKFRRAGVDALLDQVERMVSESGNADNFNAADWLSRWLATPLPALGGARPVEYMGTVEGQERISNLLAMTQSGAYA